MRNAIDVLQERGYIEQMTHEKEIRDLLNKERVTFYIGFDPTADSLHAGHFMTIMAMAHMQRCGHRPIALIGGGTTMVGDPTDRTDMRRMMTQEEIRQNGEKFKKQFSALIDFSEGQAIMENNAEWLLPLNYVEFLRDVGIHFTVNRMLAADCYKARYETGLSFLEFNYMLMQSYDFLQLYKKHGCKMQFGGNDQWSNIISGADLIRRKENGSAYGMTFTLLTNSEGKKMGKTQAGAVWLDPEKTSPYEFFQYWRNVDDQGVEKCLKLLTFLPLEEIREMVGPGSDINQAKEKLAFEITKVVHGETEAQKVLETAKALFSGGVNLDAIPATELPASDFAEGVNLIELLERLNLVASRSEGRRLIQQGGISVAETKITDTVHIVTAEDFSDGTLLIQKGKKVFHLVKLI